MIPFLFYSWPAATQAATPVQMHQRIHLTVAVLSKFFFPFVLQLIKTAVGAWREMSNLKLLCILNSWLLSQNKLWPSSSFKAILAHVKQNIQQYIPRWVPDVRGRKHTAVGLRSPELFFKTKDTSHLCWAVRLAEGLQRLEEGKGRLSYTKECQFMPHQPAVM